MKITDNKCTQQDFTASTDICSGALYLGSIPVSESRESVLPGNGSVQK